MSCVAAGKRNDSVLKVPAQHQTTKQRTYTQTYIRVLAIQGYRGNASTKSQKSVLTRTLINMYYIVRTLINMYYIVHTCTSYNIYYIVDTHTDLRMLLMHIIVICFIIAPRQV